MKRATDKEKDESIEAIYSKRFSPAEAFKLIGDCIDLGMSDALIKKISSLVKGLDGNYQISMVVWDKNLLTKKQLAELTEGSGGSDNRPFVFISDSELINYERNSYTVVNSISKPYLSMSVIMNLGRKSELVTRIRQKVESIKLTEVECIKVAMALDIL
ncbi:MAG: hypothetical protein WC238_02160 [Parcubacteria group bacterium]|jgi:hypothetical protein